MNQVFMDRLGIWLHKISLGSSEVLGDKLVHFLWLIDKEEYDYN